MHNLGNSQVPLGVYTAKRLKAASHFGKFSVIEDRILGTKNNNFKYLDISELVI